MLTGRYDEAFRYAHELHGSQKRKGSPIPYISHLMIVSGLVLENEGTEDQAIAALLHDAAVDRAKKIVRRLCMYRNCWLKLLDLEVYGIA